MYLSHLSIINYRSCKSISVKFESNQPNVLIGVNDCGKSTMLKAAKLLFDEKPTYKYSTDLGSQQDISNSPLADEDFLESMSSLALPQLPYTSNETIIIGGLNVEIDDEESNFESYSEHLRICRQFAPDNHVWMARSFCNNSGSFKTFLLCKKHECEEQLLWSLTEAKLRGLNAELGISDEEITNINGAGRLSKYERIKAIYQNADPELGYTWVEYKPEKKDRPAFPEFRYLDWTCSLEDIKKQANDLLADRITSAFEDIKQEVENKVRDLEISINEELRTNLLEEIIAIVPSLTRITAKLSPAEILPKVSDILVEKNTSDNLIHIESQGEGIKRQIWYGLLKAQARRLADNQSGRKEYIWAFDEPETHLYPGAQREFFDLLREAAAGGVQIILSTHSTIFVDKTSLQDLKKVVLQNGYSDINLCQDPDDVHRSLQVKNSDFLFHDKFLVVEGPSEVNLIPHMYTIYSGGRTLFEDNIQLINLEGSGNTATNKRLFANIMADFQKDTNSIVYIFDKDQQASMDSDLADSIKFYLGTQDMEDSIASSVWVAVINEYLDEKELSAIRISEEDINQIKDSITPSSTSEHDKFVKKLGKRLIQIQGDSENKEYLPSKPELSMRVCRHISSMNQICPQLIAAFDALSENNAESAVNQLLNEAGVEVEQ